jgi:hypothetical protein
MIPFILSTSWGRQKYGTVPASVKVKEKIWSPPFEGTSNNAPASGAEELSPLVIV